MGKGGVVLGPGLLLPEVLGQETVTLFLRRAHRVGEVCWYPRA